MKKVVAAGAATAVLAGGLGFQTYQVHQLGEDLVKVENKYLQTVQNLNETTEKYKDLLLLNQKVEKEVEDLKVNVNTLTESNTTLQKQVKENQATIDSKNSEIKQLQSQISQLKTVTAKARTTQSTNQTAKASTVKTSNTSKSSVSTTSNTTSKVKATYTMSARAYTTAANGDPNTSGKWGNKTASGTTPKQGRTIAVDKSLIPLGTKVRLTFPKGWEHLNGIYYAEDTGSAIKGLKIDVFFNSYNTCIQFGKRTVKLEVL